MNRTKILILAAATAGAGFAAQAHDVVVKPVMSSAGRPSPVHVQAFASPESALVPDNWDKAIVSNQDGDNPGFLSILNPDGTVEDLHWVDSDVFINPTGMRAFEDTLYVANGTQIVSVDMDAAEVTGSFECPDARFVNDIATGPDGTAYGSESFGAGIYMVAPGSDTCEWFIEPGHEMLTTINGLLGLPDALIAVTIPGNVVSIDYDTGEATLLGSGVGSLDGVEPYGDALLLADTNGKILLFHDGESQVLVDSSGAGFGSNDMAYDPETGTIFLARARFNMISLYHIEEAE